MKLSLLATAAALAVSACNCTPAQRQNVLPTVSDGASYADEACAALHAILSTSETVSLLCRFEHVISDGTRRTIEILRSADAGTSDAVAAPPPAPATP